MEKLEHKHILIKANVLKPPMSEIELNTWFKELVDNINMKVCIEPRSSYVADVGNRGITGVCGIQTSHIALHAWDEMSPSVIQMDVYSCRDFEPETVLKKLNDFVMVDYEMMLIDREDGFKVLKHDKVKM